MYLEAKETARLYKLLSDKLGNDTTEAMFKYIDNKTERSVEATIKTLATKEDLYNTANLLQNDLHGAIAGVKDDIAKVRDDVAKIKFDLSKEISSSVKWMFVFW